jgi:hypothetical protein
VRNHFETRHFLGKVDRGQVDQQRHVTGGIIPQKLTELEPPIGIDDDGVVSVLRVTAEDSVGKLVSHKFD